MAGSAPSAPDIKALDRSLLHSANFEPVDTPSLTIRRITILDTTELAALYRLRADQARAVAGGLFDWEERNRLLQTADEYEQRARDVEGIDDPQPRLSTI
jgi:hypothetical protein